jgi:hypothetical protein
MLVKDKIRLENLCQINYSTKPGGVTNFYDLLLKDENTDNDCRYDSESMRKIVGRISCYDNKSYQHCGWNRSKNP